MVRPQFRDRPREREGRCLDFGRSAGGENLAVVEHRDAVGDREHDVHVVLDHQDRERPRQARRSDRSCAQSRRATCPRSAHRAATAWARRQAQHRSRAGAARHRKDCGPDGDRRRRDARAASVPRRARSMDGTARSARKKFSGLPRRASTASRRFSITLKIHEQIVALERAGNARTANPVRRPAGDVDVVEQDAARGRRQLTADLIDQAGLAGAVGTDDDVALALLDGQVDIVGDDEAAERRGRADPMRNTLMTRPFRARSPGAAFPKSRRERTSRRR